ncbi:hypothetical protein CROQUDRAFT_175263 [Cronartium quercuum f. sp. fusiforme G11]|uniref:Uncharacterized protein n=1 Tax=Cronartium quercuum f. sp. fusiforme G11 TaxID=708437 RepID=A0A9P6TH82_9BASI|nr:hypothetical protein CROQUDRAFT_175263 [Cronartium quercuum f. sp. fusiforme G11]
MYLFPPSYTTSSYYLYRTSLPCLLYTSDPIASDLYPLAPIASRSQYSHPSVTTVHNLTIRPEF